jgi:peroxiredoxin
MGGITVENYNKSVYGGQKRKGNKCSSAAYLFFALFSWFDVYNFNMAYKKTKIVIWLGIAVLATGLIFGCKKAPQQAMAADQNQAAREPNRQADPNATAKQANNSKPTLRDIIRRRNGWGPIYTNLYGKEAPDFNVTDITGKQHTLSQYRGKNVILIFWATWCNPCLKEIPHLIELRKTYGEDKLAMLGISFIGPMNSTEAVRKLVAANPAINYTIISTDESNLPGPYSEITGIPSSFFIDPQGRIKMATEGMISLPQIMAIIEAEK